MNAQTIPDRWLQGCCQSLERHRGLNPRQALQEAIRQWNEQVELEAQFETQKRFKVIVPLKERKKVKGRWVYAVSYPWTGDPLYTRERAIEVMKQFYLRCPWEEGDQREIYAEGTGERFTLHYPQRLV